jgi:hypothetical protein
VQLGGPPARTTGPAARPLDRGHGVDHRFQQQEEVVGVGGRQADGQRDAAAVDQQVVQLLPDAGALPVA